MSAIGKTDGEISTIEYEDGAKDVVIEELLCASVEGAEEKQDISHLQVALSKRLAKRPSFEEIGINIYKNPEDVAENAAKLAKVRQSLNIKLDNRPSRDRLLDTNIIKQGVSSFHKKKSKLHHSLIKNALCAQLTMKFGRAWALSNTSCEARPVLSYYSAPSPIKTLASALCEFEKPVRRLSLPSLHTKTQFIQDLEEQGSFVCHNCCCQDFQGPSLSSHRYTYKQFFEENSWGDLNAPFHGKIAIEKSLCNQCAGLCTCGYVLSEGCGFCNNCGSLPSVTVNQERRAPEYPRPMWAEDLIDRRKTQLANFSKSKPRFRFDSYTEGEEKKTKKISFLPKNAEPLSDTALCSTMTFFVHRYRYQNPFTAETLLCYFNNNAEEDVEETNLEYTFFIDGESEELEVSRREPGYWQYSRESSGQTFVICTLHFDKDEQALASDDMLSPRICPEDINEEDDEDEDDDESNLPLYPTPRNLFGVYLVDPNDPMLFYYAEKKKGEYYVWQRSTGKTFVVD